MDAISMLKDDHKTVEQLFKRFEKAGPRAHVEKREVVDRIIEELSIHAAVEEQLFYPVTRATVPDTEDIALESLEEHHIVKWVLSELEEMSPEDERFDAKVTVLIENVRHHVEEEEGEYFPKVRDELGRSALNDIGEAMEAAKKVAPTHPHPRSPDTAPANLVTGTAAGVVDRVGDTMSGLAQGGASAVGDLVAKVLGRKKPRSSPTGSSTARRTAAKVRQSAGEATESVIDAARRAKRTGRASGRAAARGTASTARAAKSGAEGTATSARKAAKGTGRSARKSARGTAASARRGAKRTSSTAKRAATTTGRTARKAAKRTGSTAKRASKRTASR